MLGSTANIFKKADIPSVGRLSSLFSHLFQSHPGVVSRQNSIQDISTVFRADKILFFIQGYFGTLCLELLLQALFSTARGSPATLVERRLNLHRFLEADLFATLLMISLFSILIACSHILVVTRLAITISTFWNLSHTDRIQLLSRIPFLVGAGAILSLSTSVNNLWDLKQLNWQLIPYFSMASDRLFMHGIALLFLFAILGVTISRATVILNYTGLLFILGIAPVCSALALGAFIYL